MKILLLILISYSQIYAEVDPREYDLCVKIHEGKYTTIKNSLKLDVGETLKTFNVDVSNASFFLLKKNDKFTSTKILHIHQNEIRYRLSVINGQYAMFRISPDEFSDYLEGKVEWRWMPEYYFDSKSNVALELVPRRVKK